MVKVHEQLRLKKEHSGLYESTFCLLITTGNVLTEVSSVLVDGLNDTGFVRKVIIATSPNKVE